MGVSSQFHMEKYLLGVRFFKVTKGLKREK